MVNKISGFIRNHFSTLISLFDQGVVSGGNFLIAIILTNFLGLEQYGTFVLIWMAVLFCSSIQQAFVIAPLMTIGAKSKIKYRKQYLTVTFIQNFGYILLATLLAFVLAQLSDQFFPEWEVKSFALELSAVIFAFLLNDYFRKFFFLIDKIRVALFVDTLNYALQLGGIYMLYHLDSLTISNVIGIIALSLFVSQSIGFVFHPLGRFDERLFKVIFWKHWQFSRWLTGTAVLTWLSSNYIIIAAGALLGSTEVGAVRMAQTVMGVLTVLFLAYENLIPPTASRIYSADGKKALLKYLVKMSGVGSGVVAVVLALIFIFPEEIIRLLYKEEYVEFAYVLQGFAILNLFVFIGGPLRFLLRTLERTRPIFIAYILSAVFSIVTANYLVGGYGLYGVVAGLIITQCITLGYYLFSVRKDIFS